MMYYLALVMCEGKVHTFYNVKVRIIIYFILCEGEGHTILVVCEGKVNTYYYVKGRIIL